MQALAMHGVLKRSLSVNRTVVQLTENVVVGLNGQSRFHDSISIVLYFWVVEFARIPEVKRIQLP